MTTNPAARAQPMLGLTEAQQRVLNAIAAYIDKHGFPPSRQDICDACGFKSANAAEEHLKTLANKGVIELTPKRARGIRITNEY